MTTNEMQLKIPGIHEIEMTSVVKCIHCRHKELLRMPNYAIRSFYECTRCKKVLRPRDGSCCIFCSYGSVPCPNAQKKKLGQ